MRRRARVDDSQGEIVGVLRGHGATVVSLAAVGSGCPDLVVGLNGHTYLVEVKDGRKKPSARALTPDQEEFHAWWRGGAILMLETAEQADRWARVPQTPQGAAGAVKCAVRGVSR